MPDVRREVGQEVCADVWRDNHARILIRSPVNVYTHQLLGRSIRHCAHRHVRGGQPADLGQLARYPEVSQQHPPFTVLWLGEQDVGRFNISVQ